MTRRQTRLITLGLVLSGLIIATGLSLFALRETITFFYSPADLIGPGAKYEVPENTFRLGGLVAGNSVSRQADRLYFTITDGDENIKAVYRGLPPDLFREGQGVVATGQLVRDNKGDYLFRASQLLAKHDENYMPPEVARALEKRQDKNSTGYGDTPSSSSGSDTPYGSDYGE